MICRCCKFYQGGYMWNRCALSDSEYFREYSDTPCPDIDDNYIFREDCAPLGFVKGESALKFMKCEDTE